MRCVGEAAGELWERVPHTGLQLTRVYPKLGIGMSAYGSALLRRKQKGMGVCRSHCWFLKDHRWSLCLQGLGRRRPDSK